MKSILRNYVLTVFDQVNQTTLAYQLNVDGDISSLGMELTKVIRCMCTHTTDSLEIVRGGVLDLYEGRSS